MSKLFKKMELMKVPFKKLLKLELPELTDSVVRVLEKHDPKKLQIERVFDLLETQKPSIKLLIVGYGVHPLANELSEANDKLLLYVGAIKFQLRMAIKENEADKQEHALIVQLAVNNYLHKLRSSKNHAVLNRRVAQFLHETTTDAELALALKSLNIIEYHHKLQLALKSVRDLQGRKAAIVSQRPKETTTEISAPIIFALKNVFKQVELSRATNPDLDYTDLFNELNVVINEYRGKVTRREAFNKRKAEKKKALKIVDSIEQPEVKIDLEKSSTSAKMKEKGGMAELVKANDVKDPKQNAMNEEKVIAPQKIPAPIPVDVASASDSEPALESDIKKVSIDGVNAYFNHSSVDPDKSVAKSSKHLQMLDFKGDT